MPRMARKREDLSWKEYAERLDEYLHRIEDLLWPDVIVVGGDKQEVRFFPHLTARTRVVRAEMLNEAGIAGAALAGVPDGSLSRPPMAIRSHFAHHVAFF